jgi:hypothetical protein
MDQSVTADEMPAVKPRAEVELFRQTRQLSRFPQLEHPTRHEQQLRPHSYSTTALIKQLSAAIMPTFWDLPRNVRDKIYRFSLVQEGVIDPDDFKKACGIKSDWWLRERGMPFLLQLCERTEQEAAEIFFGENTFFARITETHVWHGMIYPRHFKLIRKFSVGGWDWPETYGPGYTSGFRMLRSFKSLDTVTVTINEQESLEDLLSHRSTIKWHKSLGLSPQLHLKVLNFNGIPGLRSLRNIYRINFKSKSLRQRTATGDGDEFERGDIVGGFLDTTLRQEIAGPIKPKK